MIHHDTMIYSHTEKETIQRNTRILYRNKRNQEYIMTNQNGSTQELLRIFAATIDGTITMEGPLLGSLFAHDPYIIPDLEKVECTFEELNASYFNRDPIVDGLIGQAVGDAFGVPVEFMSRDKVRELSLHDMVGNDCLIHFTSRWSTLIPSGAWSDDTSMTIAAMASIINHQGEIDYDDIMKQFLAWWDDGEYASLGFPFGLGRNISCALQRYREGVPALDCGGKGMMDNGNGALMRIFPFSMYCIMNELTENDTIDVIRKAAGITHGHDINAMSCFIYTLFLDDCIRTRNPWKAYENSILYHTEYFSSMFSEEAIRAHEPLVTKFQQSTFNPDSIMESGYVVDSLMVAIYSILHTENYEDAIRMAVNFGYDTDTNAAITGSIAGAMYGQDQIPEKWLNQIKKKEYLMTLGRQFSKILAHLRRDNLEM